MRRRAAASWRAGAGSRLGRRSCCRCIAVLAPFVAPYAPDALDLAARRAPPSLGTLVRHRRARTRPAQRACCSARASRSRSACCRPLVAAVASGAGIGAGAGYRRRGWIDALLMRVTDAMLAMPRLPLLMIASVDPPAAVPLLDPARRRWSAGWRRRASCAPSAFAAVARLRGGRACRRRQRVAHRRRSPAAR